MLKDIYQGEPYSFFMAKKVGGAYVPLPEDDYEALVKGCGDDVVKGWSTADGTMDRRTMTIGGQEIEGLSFGLTGEDTAKLWPGRYTFESARVLGNGRAIGIIKDIVEVKAAAIRRGV